MRPLIDYGDIIIEQPQNKSFCEKIASVQGLGLKPLKLRKWHKRLVCMFKIMNEENPNYLIDLIHRYEPTIRTRNNSIPLYKC